MKCCNCNECKTFLINLPLYGLLCNECYYEIYRDYLK